MIKIYHKKTKGVWFGAAVQENQVLSTYFSTDEPNFLKLKQGLTNGSFQVLEEPNRFLKKVLNALENIFNGRSTEKYCLNTDLSNLSSYSQKVLNFTYLVPVGYVTTYKALAKAAGGIARSVGRVEAINPIPLLIPCHRVVCSDFRVGGYGYGEQIKVEILQREERGYEKIRQLITNDKKLVIYPVKMVNQRRRAFKRNKKLIYSKES